MGFPIRKSADQSLFAAPHGLSQRTTSFIACAYQGIHRTPLFHFIALIINARPFQDTSLARPIRERNKRHPTRPSRTRTRSATCLKRQCGLEPIARAGQIGPERPVSHENFPSASAVKQRPASRSSDPGRTRTGRPKNSSLHDVSQQATARQRSGSLQTFLSRQAAWPANHEVVEPDGIEPTTSCLQSTRSPN